MLKPSFVALIFSLTALTHAEDSLLSRTKTLPKQVSNKTETSPQQSVPCDSGARTMRVAARHIEAGGIGYDEGYTTVEGFFAPNPSSWSYMPFLDVRGHVFNDGRLAANAGVGVRTLFGCRGYGINAYYDYRKTQRQHYNQVAVGLETLGAIWDLRINGYLPVGEKKSHPFDTRFDHFTGNSIILSQKVEFAMKGADAEVGVHFDRTTDWDSWIAAGPYYFIGERGSPTWGGKARIGVSFSQYLTVEFLNSWDNTFHYRPQGQITLAWPFGPKAVKKKESACSCSLPLRLVQPVNRQEIVVVNRRHRETPAIDPSTGALYTVLFVDNTSSSAGTYESPYPTLAQAEAASSPGDIIYVFPGDGTTTGMNMGITLQPNQKFWGSGVSHPLVTTQGGVSIPSQSAGLPLLTNTTGSGITLASGNDVSGFFITRPNLHGITGSDVNHVSLSNLTLFAAQNNMNGGNGINIIENNGIVNTLTLQNLVVTNNAVNGIFIQTQGTSGANLFIGSSQVSLNGTSTNGNNGIVLNAMASSTMAATLQGNTILSNLNEGVVLDSATTGALSYLLADNTIEGNQSQAISGAFPNSPPVTITLTGNSTIGNYGGTGAPFGVNIFTFTGPSTLTATGNHFDQNIAQGALSIIAGNSLFTGLIENNSISQNCDQGFTFNANGTQLVTLVFQNNNISDNCADGLNFISGVAANLDLTFSNNTIERNNGDGVNISPHALNALTFVASGNSFSGNLSLTGNGLNFSPTTVNSLSLTINENTMNGNGFNAIKVVPGTINTLTVVANENTAVGNCGSMLLIGDTSSNITTSLSVTANSNTMMGNCGPAVFIKPVNGASLTSFQLTASNNFMKANAEAGFDIQTLQADTLITLDNNQILNTLCFDGGGISLNSAPLGSANLAITCSNNTVFACFDNIGGNAPHGIDFIYQGTNTGTNSFTANNNTVSYNGGDGIRLSAFDGNTSAMTLDISNNAVSYNKGNGINIVTAMTSPFTFHTTLSGNTVNNNDLNGINIDVDGVDVDPGTDTAFFIHADQNTLFNNNPFGTSDMLVTNSLATGTVCLEMSGNSSNVGYSLVNSNAGAMTFNLAPTNVDAVNIGTITRGGGGSAINSVSTCAP